MAVPSEREICDWCVDFLVQTMEMPAADVAIDVKFSRLGLDSASSAHFILALEEWLGVPLELDLTANYPTITDLARHLQARFPRVGGG